MRTPHRRRLFTAATVMLLAATAAACGSDDSSDVIERDRDRDRTEETRAEESPTTEPTVAAPATTAAPEDQPASTITEAPEGSTGAVADLQDVRSAVVQIEAVGTSVDPEFGSVEGAGRGSGFVIDPSGIAVTNNYVVTGAGLLQVAVDGEDDPRNARVLGVSECSDLAVIQIDGPELPYLEWAAGADVPGTEIYVAGFPLGDPEYTLTRGVIAKAKANGDTNWASIDHTLEHDAAAQPGNSGGPLVTPEGQVAGIHYASYSQTNTSQFVAIAADIARPIVDELAGGVDIDSIGVSGQIVQSEDGSLSGLWVAGIASGSPATRWAWSLETSSPASKASPSASTARCATTATCCAPTPPPTSSPSRCCASPPKKYSTARSTATPWSCRSASPRGRRRSDQLGCGTRLRVLRRPRRRQQHDHGDRAGAVGGRERRSHRPR